MTEVSSEDFLVIIEGPCPVDPQVLQHGSLGTDGNVEKPVLSDRRYANRHLPAVHFAVDGQAEGLQLGKVKVIITVC